MRHGALGCAICVLLGGWACAPEGRVRFRFVLEEGAQIERPGLFAHLRVLDSSGNTLSGTVDALASEGPLLVEVPYGASRSAVLEVRDGADLAGSKVLFYGTSKAFDFNRGDTVQEDITVRSVPLISSVEVLSELGALTSSSTVALRVQVRAHQLQRIIIAQNPGLSAARQALEVAPIETNRYETRYDLNASCEASCPDGIRSLFVRAIDRAGYASESFSTRLNLDTTPPQVVPGSSFVRYPRPPGALFDPRAASLGASVLVSFALTEPVVATPTVTLASSGLPMTFVQQSENNWTFERMITSQDREGSDSVVIDALDRFGNRANLTVEGPLVDRTPPPKTSVQTPGAVVFQSRPWGDAQTRGLPSYSLLGAEGAAPADHRVLVFDRPEIFENGVQVSTLMGEGRSDSKGRFLVQLAPLGVNRAFVLIADDAGNTSGATADLVRDIEWTAVAAAEDASNAPPIEATQMTRMPTTLIPKDVFSQRYSSLAAANLDDPSAAGPVISALPRWTRHPIVARAAPSPRTSAASVFDPVRDRAFLIGGQDQQVLNDIWDWDGEQFTPRLLNGTSPSCENDALQAEPIAGYATFVATADRTLLVCQEAGRLNVHAFDGSVWTRRATDGAPPPRVGHAVAYDGQRMVLFGGRSSVARSLMNDTWALTVEDVWAQSAQYRWTQVQSTSSPSPRQRHAMATDAQNSRAWLFGGQAAGAVMQDDLWVLESQGWRQIPKTSPWPSPRHSASLLHDGDTLILAGGFSDSAKALTDVWRFDGVRWSPLSPALNQAPPGPLAWLGHHRGEALFHTEDGRRQLVSRTRLLDTTPSLTPPATPEFDVPFPFEEQRSAVYYPPEQSMLLSFRTDVGVQTWSWSPRGWALRVTAENGPGPASLPRMGYDPIREQLLMVVSRAAPGRTGKVETWRLEDDQWVNLDPQPNSLGELGFTASSRAYFEFDARRGKLMLQTSSGAEVLTHLWNGSNWEQLPAADAQMTSQYVDVVYDTHRAQHFVVGRRIENDQVRWFYRTFDQVWSPRKDLVQKEWSDDFELVYDELRGYPMLFSSPSLGPTRAWSFDGEGFVELEATGAAPPAQFRDGLVYDRTRHRVVAYTSAQNTPEYQAGVAFSLDLDPRARPALRLELNLAQAGVLNASSVEVRTIAGASSFPTGRSTEVPGVELLVWNTSIGRWQTIGANSATLNTPEALTAQLSSAVTQFILPEPARLNLAIAAAHGQGRGLPPPSIRVDDLQLIVRYRLEANDAL